MKKHIYNDKIKEIHKKITKDNIIMKILKRIVYTLLGLLIAGTVALVGIILYAEYSGKRFTPDSVQALVQLDSPEDESRLVYDENNNIIELPKIQETEETADSPDSSGHSAADSAETAADDPAAAPAEDTAADSAAAAPAADAGAAGADIERPYVMDLGSALFHTPDCPYAANIAADKRSEMTTTGAKIMNAGYLPCTNCHPDTAAAGTAADSSAVEISNELGY